MTWLDIQLPDLGTTFVTKVVRTPLEAALVYAARGWLVFPLYWIKDDHCACGNSGCSSAGKHPLGELVPSGHRQASLNERTIGRWWSRFPQANVGIKTGFESKLIVLDIDSDKGGDASFVKLESSIGPIRTERRVATGSGGMHLYFGHPGNGRSFQNSASKLGTGLDIRADGGYVVAPPSRNLKGKYAWL